jgi:hypothetical protein
MLLMGDLVKTRNIRSQMRFYHVLAATAPGQSFATTTITMCTSLGTTARIARGTGLLGDF